MSETVKLIIEIPKVPKNDHERWVLANGIPLDSHDSDYAEAQAYFAGMSYGWEQGQKDFAEKLKAEIEDQKKWLSEAGYNAYNVDIAFSSIKLLADNMGKEDKE